MSRGERPDTTMLHREKKLKAYIEKLQHIDVAGSDYYEVEFALDNIEKIYRNKKLIELLG